MAVYKVQNPRPVLDGLQTAVTKYQPVLQRLVDRSLSRVPNILIVSVIYQGKVLSVCLFHLLKCEDCGAFVLLLCWQMKSLWVWDKRIILKMFSLGSGTL